MNTRVKLGGLAAGLLALSGTCAAQAQEAPLSGPPVKTKRPPELEDRFSEGKADNRGALAERAVPMRAYMAAIQKLRGDAAPEGLRLSPDQEKRLAAIADDFRKASRDASTKAGAAPNGEKQDQAEMQEMRRNLPRPLEYQTKMWAVLTEPQQKFMQEEVKRVREGMEAERDQQYMKQQVEKLRKERQAAESAGKAPPPVPGGIPPEGRERARRIMERLQQLPPEEREQLLRRLEQELDRRVNERRPGAGQKDVEKKPPRIDDVEVPKPK